MFEPLRKPRHIGITFAVWLLVATAVVAAGAERAPETPDLAPYHVGDQAAYRLQSNDPRLGTLPRDEHMVIEVRDHRVVLDEQGTYRHAVGVAVAQNKVSVSEFTSPTKMPGRPQVTYELDPQTREVLGSIPTFSEQGIGTGDARDIGHHPVPCGIAVAGQLGGTLTTLPCSVGPHGPFNGSLQPAGLVWFGARPGIEYASDDGRLRLAFAQGIPFPVQLRVESQVGSTWYTTIITMDRFVRGDGAPFGGPVPDAIPLPDTRDPHPITNFEEAAVAAAWPLADAWVRFAQDPEGQAFLDAHPNALLRYAQFSDTSDSDGVAQQWMIILDDGAHAQTFRVGHTQRAGEDVAGTPLWIEAAQGPREQFTVHAGSVVEPRAVHAPQTVPDLSDLIVLHERLIGPMDSLSYGFYFWDEWHFVIGEWSPLRGLLAVDEAGRLRSVYPEVDMNARPTESWMEAKAEAAPEVVSLIVRPDGLSAAGFSVLAAAGAALLYYLHPLAKAGLAPLFTRIRKPDALEHPVRARLHATIEAEPGLHFQELLRRTDAAAGQARHHLRVLEEHGLVSSRKSGGFLTFFPGLPSRAQRLRAGKVQGPSARKVLAFIQAHPEAAMQDVADGTGLSPSTVSYHVHRLREAELVQADMDGRSVRLVAC